MSEWLRIVSTGYYALARSNFTLPAFGIMFLPLQFFLSKVDLLFNAHVKRQWFCEALSTLLLALGRIYPFTLILLKLVIRDTVIVVDVSV